MKVQLDPQLVNSGTLYITDPHPPMTEGSTFMGLSLDASREFSFIVQINTIDTDSLSDSPLPRLVVNKNIIGNLQPGDIIDLFPYQVPIAQKMTMGISESYLSITSGDWTASLKELLEGKLFDYNDLIKIPLNIDNKILILRGYLLDAEPEAPIQIGPTTKILLEKYADTLLTEKRETLDEQKAIRTRVIQDSILQDLILNLKQSQPKLSQTMDLLFEEAHPKTLDAAVKDLFANYEQVHEKILEDSKKTFAVSRAYLSQKTDQEELLLEYQLSASKDHGTLVLNCFSSDNAQSDTLLRSLKKAIYTIHMGLKEKPSKKEIRNYAQVFILDRGSTLQEIGTPQLPLAKLYQDFKSQYPDWPVDLKDFKKLVKKMAKRGTIADLQKLETGYYMIHFHPLELTLDPTKILRYARSKGVVSQDEIMTEFGWNEYRVQKALDFLVDRNLAKKQTSYREGTRYFVQKES